MQFHVDSLHLEISNLYQLKTLADTRIKEKDNYITLLTSEVALADQEIVIYKEEAKGLRKQNKLLKLGLGAVSGLLVVAVIR